MFRRLSLPVIVLVAQLTWTTPAIGQEETPRLDNYGDPLAKGAVLRLGTIRLQATGGFCWMPDGKSLVTACERRIWFWDSSDGRPLKSLPAAGNSDTTHYILAVSQDGSKLVCASDNGDLSIHDLKSGKEISRPRKRDIANPRLDNPEIGVLAMAPDGTSFVTANYHQNVRLWDTQTGQVLLRLPVDASQSDYPCLTYSPDSRYLAYACGTTIRIFDLDDLARPDVLEKVHGKETTSLAFAPDGKFLISLGTSKYERRKSDGGKEYVTNHCELRIWDLAEKGLQQELVFPEPMAGDGLMAVAPNGKTLVTMHRETSLVWDVQQAKIMQKLPPLMSRYGRTRMHAAIDQTGRFLAFNSHSTHLRIWDLETGKDRVAPEKRHNALITALACSHDGRLAAAGDGAGGVRLWDMKSGEWIRTLPENDGWIRGLAFSKDDSRLYVGAEGYDDKNFKFIGRLNAFNVSDGPPLFDRSFPNRVVAISLSHDNSKIAVSTGLGEAFIEPGSDPMVHICDASSGKTLAEVKSGEGKIVALVWTNDNRRIFHAAQDNTIRTIDVEAGKQTEQIAVPHERIFDGKLVTARLDQALISPDRSRAFTCSFGGNPVHRWDLENAAQIWALPTPGSSNMRIALSPDERVLASAWMDFERQQFGLALWEVATRKQLLELKLPQEQVYSMAFSPDGRRIVTGLETGSALVWDVSAAWQQLSSADKSQK